MEAQPKDNICEEVDSVVNVTEETQEGVATIDEALQNQSTENMRAEKNYGKKFSARLYKYFSLLTFFIYYFNFLLRVGMRCSSYFKAHGITSFSIWWSVVTDSVKFGAMCKAIFDWYTITLLVFLFLYSAIFLITFIRFSPKHKKTFKYFKKGFVMARRVIKLISVGLTLTVLVNSAQLATFSDKFMFIISLLSIIFTFMQICVSLTTWIIGKKLNRSVKQYVGTVMSNYIATARVRPQNVSSGKKTTVGDKIGKAKDRFLRTIETLTLTNEEAMRRAAELDGYVIDNNDLTERFENDYQPSENKILQEEQNKKSKKEKLGIKKDKRILVKKEKSGATHHKSAKTTIFNKTQKKGAVKKESEKINKKASDLKTNDKLQDKENNESIT